MKSTITILKKVSTLSLVFLLVNISIKAQWSTNGNYVYCLNGNVGIGINSPTELLSLKKADNVFLKIETNYNQRFAGIKFVGYHNGSTATSQIYMDYYGATGHHGLNFVSGRGGYDHFWFKNSAGNVLFAVKTQPTGYGRIVIPANAILEFGKENPNNGYFTLSTSASNYNTYGDYKGNLYFRVADLGGSTLGLQNDGTVVIGVWEKYDNTKIDLQGNKLLVNGGILCESVKVIQDVPNSDYVFENGYNLLNLEEIEEYVKKEKHLPEVPSAQEFKENGYSLSKMDDILLRKIEELTLYLIELKNENKALKAELMKLENNEF